MAMLTSITLYLETLRTSARYNSFGRQPLPSSHLSAGPHSLIQSSTKEVDFPVRNFKALQTSVMYSLDHLVCYRSGAQFLGKQHYFDMHVFWVVLLILGGCLPSTPSTLLMLNLKNYHGSIKRTSRKLLTL